MKFDIFSIKWPDDLSEPSHYLNQWWIIVNQALGSKLHWYSNQNAKLFIHVNAFDNVVCEMASILSRGRWVNTQSVISFSQILSAILNYVNCWTESYMKSLISRETYKKHVENLVSTVPAEGLAPFGARPSAGAVLANFGCHTYMKLTLEELSVGRLILHICLFSMNIWHRWIRWMEYLILRVVILWSCLIYFVIIDYKLYTLIHDIIIPW